MIVKVQSGSSSQKCCGEDGCSWIDEGVAVDFPSLSSSVLSLDSVKLVYVNSVYCYCIEAEDIGTAVISVCCPRMTDLDSVIFDVDRGTVSESWIRSPDLMLISIKRRSIMETESSPPNHNAYIDQFVMVDQSTRADVRVSKDRPTGHSGRRDTIVIYAEGLGRV